MDRKNEIDMRRGRDEREIGKEKRRNGGRGRTKKTKEGRTQGRCNNKLEQVCNKRDIRGKKTKLYIARVFAHSFKNQHIPTN